ncbi:hypothetical protein [uncultured Thiodictyon sp.]|uniref:hypothetical protein n=1 Tax=uncultured Thiodictyon sp. TaxID=1846217 RepID=UPI0025DAFD8D|nr:hypothetical protein [uncultured Thiodictyon sp.]
MVDLLAHPERLKQEYERRLDRLQQEHQVNADTAALERQQRHLEQGKFRLIDSYTEGLIDKADFDPKMTHVKLKLEQVAGQIATAKQHHAGQFELFLVINRLEEFAAAINDRLTIWISLRSARSSAPWSNVSRSTATRSSWSSGLIRTQGCPGTRMHLKAKRWDQVCNIVDGAFAPSGTV